MHHKKLDALLSELTAQHAHPNLLSLLLPVDWPEA